MSFSLVQTPKFQINTFSEQLHRQSNSFFFLHSDNKSIRETLFTQLHIHKLIVQLIIFRTVTMCLGVCQGVKTIQTRRTFPIWYFIN